MWATTTCLLVSFVGFLVTHTLFQGFPDGSVIDPPAKTGSVDAVPALGRCLQKEIAAHCNILYCLSH